MAHFGLQLFVPASGAPMSSSCAPGWPRRPSLGRRIVPELFDDTGVGSVSHSCPRLPVGRSGSNSSPVGLGACGLSFAYLYTWLTKGGLSAEVAFASRGSSTAVGTVRGCAAWGSKGALDWLDCVLVFTTSLGLMVVRSRCPKGRFKSTLLELLG